MGLDLFASRIRELRSDMKMTQLQFAKLIGITTATLSGYENDFKKPSIAVLTDIAQKCDVSVDWLCGLSDKKSNSIKITTFSDVIQLLLKLDEVEQLHINTFIDEHSPKCANIIFLDQEMVQFIAEWDKMRELYQKNIFDIDMYNLWKEKTLNKYNIEIDKLPFK